MSVVQKLMAIPGVLAAGEYAYRGDRFSYKGQLAEELARMASLMCRATTMATHMQMDMLQSLTPVARHLAAKGWMVRGEKFSVCVMANYFCFVSNDATRVQQVMQLLHEEVTDVHNDFV